MTRLLPISVVALATAALVAIVCFSFYNNSNTANNNQTTTRKRIAIHKRHLQEKLPEEDLEQLEIHLTARKLQDLEGKIDWGRLEQNYESALKASTSSSPQRKLQKKNRRAPKKNNQRRRDKKRPRGGRGPKPDAASGAIDLEELKDQLSLMVEDVLSDALPDSQDWQDEDFSDFDFEEEPETETDSEESEEEEVVEEESEQQEAVTAQAKENVAPAATDGDSMELEKDGNFKWQYSNSEPFAAQATSASTSSAGGVTPRVDAPGGGDDGIALPIYNYNLGNCPGEGDSDAAVPCAPDNLEELCDKYDENDAGSFSACFEACTPSFCCIHNADPVLNFIAPNCNTDVNCAQYAYCYIVWWKLHDTIGQAQALRLEQNDDFYDVDATFIQGDVTNVEFFREMLFHHFDDANEIIRLGTVEIDPTTSEFDSDIIFLDEQYWDTNI